MMDMQQIYNLKRLVEPDLLKRLRPNTPQTAAFQGVIKGCFGLLEEIAREREHVNHSSSLGANGRKAEMNRIAQDHLARNFADLTRPARKLRRHVDEQREASPHGSMSKDLAALQDDVAVAEAAIYFARRELEPASGLSGYAFDNLVDGIDAGSVR